jgi:thiamine biosynthesis lipoprotein
METGQNLFISEICYDCIRIAAEAHEQTGGLFDITLGKLIEHQKNEVAGDAPQLTGKLSIDPDRPMITCETAGREIDLGGIGKGYALDQLKLLLEDWGIESALLCAGASTQLAFGSKTWPIELSGDHNQQSIELHNQALSASGVGIQGSHIVSPLERSEAAYTFKRAWILQPSAAMADAWSTALMLVDAEQLRTFEAPQDALYFEAPTGIHSLQQIQDTLSQ